MKTSIKRNKEVTMNYIGLEISSEMARCIRLYAYSNKLAIAQVLRSIIRNWINETCVTEEILINDIVSKSVDEWNKQKFIDSFADLNEFKGHWREDLNKRLPDSVSDKILNEFNNRIKPNEKKANPAK